MQLVAYGAQDIYLTGNPQITFWKVVYRRHTNFSMESIEQTFNGSADFGRKVTCTISRNGDLLSRVYLQCTVPQVTADDVAGTKQHFRWVNWLGHALIESCEVEIGGQKMDKHYGDWLHIWNELTQTAGHQTGYANMVGNVPGLTQVVSNGGSTPAVTLYIPLQFWFCRNPGLALPLIALQYHEVKINLTFRKASECYWNPEGGLDTPKLEAASLYVDYIYLDTDERRRFAQVSHEYLIEQLQFTGDESTSSTNNKIKLNFNHPCKELVWVVQPEENVSVSDTARFGGPQYHNYTDALDKTYYTGVVSDPLGGGMASQYGSNPFNPQSLPLFGASDASGNMFAAGDASAGANAGIGDDASGNEPLHAFSDASTTQASGLANVLNPNFAALNVPLFDSGCNPVKTAKLQLNGHDRFSLREGRYFNLVQPYQHHTNVPPCGINVYSFGLRPEEHQPSGTCNMSRIDNATLQLNLTENATKSGTDSKSCRVRVYATNYNVLRIMSGMGGLAYSN